VTSASATSLIKVGLAEQTRAAGAIVRGHVTDIRTRATGTGIVYTYAEISIGEILRGGELVDATAPLVVRQIGGATENVVFPIDGAARYVVGQEYLLFLVPDYEGEEPGWFTYGMHLGVYAVERDGGEVVRYVRQQDDGSHLIRKGSEAADGDVVTPEALAGAIGAAGPVTDAPVAQTPARFRAARSMSGQVIPAYTIWNPPTRWSRPDRGEPLYYFWNPYGFPNGGAVLLEAAERAAMEWTNVPGASVVLEIIDDTYICGLTVPGSNSEIAMDCKNEINGKGCRSGILALAAPHVSGSHEWKGTQYRTITSADIVLQDFDDTNQCPEFLNSATLANVLTHELGHTIGLAHSTERTATMYGTYHSGMGTLDADDRAGCLYLYGEPAGAPVINAIEPELGEQTAASLQVTITGARMSTGSDPSVDFGDGVTVKRVLSATEDEVTVEIAINKKARPGPREVTVETGEGVSNAAIFDVVKIIAPENLHQFFTDGINSIAWDDPSSVNTHAEVWRRVGSGDWEKLATVIDGVMTARDRDVENGRTYTYRVRNLKKGKKARKNVYSEYTEELVIER